MATSKWAEEKNRLKELSVEDRRKGYHCGNKFVPVDQIPTWREYFKQKSLKKGRNLNRHDFTCNFFYDKLIIQI